MRVVTKQSDPLFLRWLSYEAHQLGTYVIKRYGSVETTIVPENFPPDTPLPEERLPPQNDAFIMRVEKPTGYPPQAATKLQKDAGELAKQLLRRLGYSIPQRLRISRLVSLAGKYRLAQRRLPKRALYEIVAETYEFGYMNEDERRRKTVKTRRHRLRKRLVKPYENTPIPNSD